VETSPQPSPERRGRSISSPFRGGLTRGFHYFLPITGGDSKRGFPLWQRHSDPLFPAFALEESRHSDTSFVKLAREAIRRCEVRFGALASEATRHGEVRFGALTSEAIFLFHNCPFQGETKE